jgi:hypothetical protein
MGDLLVVSGLGDTVVLLDIEVSSDCHSPSRALEKEEKKE